MFVFVGLNSGVILLNLPMMRTANWTRHMIQYYEKYRRRIKLGDQDLINIFFYYYPGIREEYVNELQRNPT